MKILNVQLKHIHGGNPQVCLDYTRVLKAAGNEVFVLTNPKDPFLETHIDIADIVFASQRLGEFGSWDLFSIFYFKRLINNLSPEVIVVHEGRSAALIKRAAGNKVPVIDVNHGRSPKQSAKMNATIVTSKYQLNRYKEKLGKNYPAFYVENAMNLEGHEKPQIPRQWNNPPIIGTIGRFVEDKALDIFIDALDILNKKGIDFKVKMAGQGEQADALTKQIAQYNLQDKIIMPGWVKNPEEFYKSIDIFCFPSRKEEFGLVLLEAYKYGLPAVVSDADGPSDIVDNDKDALMVPKENATMLADALQELLNNKEKADKLAQGGYDKLVSQYDVPKVAKKLQQVLNQVAKTHKTKVAA